MIIGGKAEKLILGFSFGMFLTNLLLGGSHEFEG